MALSSSENNGAYADNPRWMAAAGTMHMSIDDLLKFGLAHLDAGKSSSAILSVDTFQRLHQPVMERYAYGWVVDRRILNDREPPETFMWHNGSNTMWYALLVILPERNAVIVMTANDASQLPVTTRHFDALAWVIAEAIATAYPRIEVP